MHLLTGEVAPLAPLLIPIGEIVVWVVALALCLLCVYLTKALFSTADSAVGWIPFHNKVVSRSLTSIEHKIVSFMSAAAASSDAKMGAAFHQLARVVDWIGHEIERQASLLFMLSSVVLGGAMTAALQAAIAALTSTLKVSHATADHALRRAIHAGHVIERGIGADVLPRTKALEREIGHIVEHDIASLRARERALEDGALHTFKWIRAHPSALASTAFAGAVAWALARLGAGWIRCNNVRGVGQKLCGPWGRLVEDLLAGVIDVLVIADLCQITKLMITTAESAPIQDALSGIIAAVDDLLLCQGVERPPALGGYWTAAPPIQSFAALPAV